MNYLLFNNDILMSDGEHVRRINKGNISKDILGPIEHVSLCVVDVDILITAAVEFPIEKKDSILVRKFKDLYQQESYIIQDERIDNNIFQVIGIKEQKVREIYALIPPDRVVSFIPYGIALRNTLINKNVDLNNTVVFVDDLGSERLLTVFDGFKFSRTRVIINSGENILPEIKRSQIDFFKKSEGFLSVKSADFVIIVNNQELADEIAKNEEKLHVEYINAAYPALEGLKSTDTSIKYRLPEENLKKRREIEFKKKVTTLVISICTAAAGLIFFMINKVEMAAVNNQCEVDRKTQGHLDDQLRKLDKETYREDLNAHKSLNYGISYLSMLEIIPSCYTVFSFKFYKTSQWNLEVTLLDDDDSFFESIPRIRILKNAEMKDILVNNQPGKHLKITL